MKKRVKGLLLAGVATLSLGALCVGLASCRVVGGGECEHVWREDKHGNCIEGGYLERYCEVCNESEYVEIAPTGHNFVNGQCVNGQKDEESGEWLYRCGAGLEYELNDEGTAYTVVEFNDPACFGAGSLEDVRENLRQYVITEIEIPAEYEGLPVTAIGENVFDPRGGYVNALTSVTIPNTVTSIGSEAFAWSNLTEIEIPDSVTTIEWGAFEGCINLTEIKLSDGLTEIPNSMFSGCKKLESIDIPESVTKIGEYSFSGCESLTSLTLPVSVTEIGYNAFSNCTAVTELIYNAANLLNSSFADFGSPDGFVLKIGSEVETVPSFGGSNLICVEFAENSVCTTFGASAFRETKIEEITFPDSLQTIGAYSFYGCTALKEIVFPDGVQTIGDNSFYGCTALKEIVFPDGVKTIGDNSFYGCTGLKEIVIPDSVTSVGGEAFADCSGVEKLTIGKNVTNLEFGSLRMASLKEIHYNAKNVTSLNPSVMYTYLGEYEDLEDECVLYIGEEVEVIPNIFGRKYIKEVRLSSLEPWFNSELSDKGPAYDADIYVGDKLLETLTIPESVTDVREYAFYGCKSLKEIIIPDHVITVGERAFSFCYNVKTLTIGKNLTYAGIDGAFKYLYSLETLNYNIAKAWGGVQFSGAGKDSAGVTVNVGADVTCLGADVFSTGSTFTSANVVKLVFAEDGVCSKIPKSAFRGCPLKSIENLPVGIDIGNEAFAYTDLTDLVIPGGAIIGESAFSNIETLQSLQLPGGVSVGRYAFYGSGLKELTIPDSATIGEYAFSDGKLENIYYAAQNCTIDNNAFANAYAESGCTLNIGGNVGALSAFQSGLSAIVLTVDFATFCGMDFETSLFALAQTVTLNGETIGSGALEIPDGVTYIGKNTFNGSSITEVTIPDSVTSIGDYAFADCSKLTAVYGGANVSACGEFAVNYALVAERLYGGIYYKFNMISRLASTDIVSIAIREGTAEIPERFFEGCEKLVHVYVPDGCEIGDRAFINTNTGIRILLGNASYPGGDWRILMENDSQKFLIGGTALVNGVQTVLGAIENGIVYDAASGFAYQYDSYSPGVTLYGYFGEATEVTLPSSLGGKTVVRVEGRAFMTLPITKAVIPATITEIDEYAFALCDKLTTASLASVEEVGSYAFYGCTALTEVTMNSVIYIRVAAFYGCTALKTVTIPSTIKYINNYAFYEAGLTSATFADATHQWYMYGSSGVIITTQDAATNATNLTSTYAQYGWIIDTEVNA